MIDARLIFARGPGADAMLGVCIDQQNAVNEAARFRAMGRGALEQHCRKVAIAAIPGGWLPDYLLVVALPSSGAHAIAEWLAIPEVFAPEPEPSSPFAAATE